MIRRLISSALVATVTAVAAFGHQKLAPELNNAEPGTISNVIVTWKQVPGSSQQTKVMQRRGEVVKAYGHLKAGAYSIPTENLPDLANDPDVVYISPDRPLKGTLDLTAAAINAPTVWKQGYFGTNVGVAVIDSGVNALPDLPQTQIVYAQDFTGQYQMHPNLIDPNNAPDTFGHGEHVAGIIASNGTTSRCGNCTRAMIGIAPGAKIINLRVLDQNGNGTDSAVIAAIDQAIELKSKYNIRVINLSIGRPVYESYTQDPLCQAVEQAWKAGIVVVVAAGNNGRDNTYGNNGYGTITAPGNDPYVITVGAMKTMQTASRTDDLIASYSSKGPTAVDYIVKPDIVAPGNMIVSLMASPKDTLATSYPSNVTPKGYYQSVAGPAATQNSNVYFNLSGTSMATPVVSAAAADLLQAQPNLTPDQVKAILMLTSYKTFPDSSTAADPVTGQTYTSYYDPFTVGAGYLDLAAAMANTNIPQGTALSPAAAYDATTGDIYFLYDPSTVWAPMGTSSPFNLGAVWPSTAISSESSAWGQRIAANSSAWGQRIMASSAAWGQQVIATSSAWGQRISAKSSMVSDVSPGVQPANPNMSAASTPTSQSTPLTVAGEN